MKVDILLRTRDYDRDYRWIFKPEYVDRVTEDKMSFLIQMMQKSELKRIWRKKVCIIFIISMTRMAVRLCGADFPAVWTDREEIFMRWKALPVRLK